MSRNEIKFWVLFFLLNFILFFPAYFIDLDRSSFLPVHSFLHGTFYDRLKCIFRRDNYDIFRFNVDLIILISIFYAFRQKLNIAFYAIFVSIYYVINLLFIVYYDVIFVIYLVPPVLYNDLYLFNIGLASIKGPFFVKILIIALLISFLVFIAFLGFRPLLQSLQRVVIGKYSRLIIIIIWLGLIINLVKSGLTYLPQHEYQMGFALIGDNISNSVQASQNLKSINISSLNKKYRYDQYLLKEKPNIYLLFIESYGKILYQNSQFLPSYMETIEGINKELKDSGYYSTSNFSTSPISGGGSWISYTSVIFGFNVRNQGSYLALLKDPGSSQYMNMLRYFKNQDYHSFWVNPLPENKLLPIPWDTYTKFYAVDKWIQDQELEYHGPRYGFGPAPPDQYSLFKAEELCNDNPHIMFYITHNSHNPFIIPDSLVADWHSMSNSSTTQDAQSVIFQKPKPMDYVKSINYDLRTVSQFIIQNKNKNAIYLVIGDHQPPILNEKKNGFDSPVHIISKDSTFVNEFRKYGFNEGMKISGKDKSIRHEAIYSMTLREMIRHYGVNRDNLPAYQPNGFSIQ